MVKISLPRRGDYMNLIKLFSLVILLSLSGFAALAAPMLPSPKGISLKPALDQLKVVVPLRHDVYPFMRFAAAPDTKTLAVVLHEKVVPADSTLDQDATIIDVSPGISRVLAVVKPLPDVRFRYMQADSLQFLDKTVLRIEFTGGVAGDNNPNRQIRTYNFFDIKSKKQFNIESQLPFTDISDVRAFSKNHYLVRHIENDVKVYSVIFFNPVTRTFKLLGQPNDDVGRALKKAIDEPGEDVWRLSDDDVYVHIRIASKNSDIDYTYMMGATETKMVPGHYGGLFDEAGMVVVGGNGALVLADNNTVSYTPNGQDVTGEWTQDEDKILMGPFYQMEGFIISDYADTPHHGWVKLSPGESEPQAITDSHFQLVQYEVMNGVIAGIGNFEPLSRDIFFYTLYVGSSVNASTPATSRTAVISHRYLEVIPVPETLPVVSTSDEHRYLFVQLNAKMIIVVDTQNPHHIAQNIELLDSKFTVLHVSETETLLHYPNIKKVVSYERPSFRPLREMKESECEHLLKPGN